MNFIEWIAQNKNWLFEGLGVAAIIGIFSVLKLRGNAASVDSSQPRANIVVNNQNMLSGNTFNSPSSENAQGKMVKKSLDAFKNETHVLFIDDEIRFKVAKILVKSGWVHTKLIKDANSLDDIDIVRADILFIDVQGVGVAMGFNDEGLGLALAIKEKYPAKKVVIYSAETKGDRFHAALRRADASLPKNADPYEFQKIVEDFTIGAKEGSV